jgi:hypothetical protein
MECNHLEEPGIDKKKVKGTLNRLESPEGGRGIALHSLDLGTRRGVGGQHHVPAALPPGKDPVPIVQEAPLHG